jgi:hypothetical protein
VFPLPRRLEAGAQASLGARGGAKWHRGDAGCSSCQHGNAICHTRLLGGKLILAMEGSARLTAPDYVL